MFGRPLGWESQRDFFPQKTSRIKSLSLKNTWVQGVAEGTSLLKGNVSSSLGKPVITLVNQSFLFLFFQMMIYLVNKTWHITNGLIFTSIEKANCFIFYFSLKLFKNFIYLFLERGGREGEREGENISVRLPLMWLPLRSWPATQACALTGNQTRDPLIHTLSSIH